MKRPIAMRCNQEQFYAIKPKLEKSGLRNSVDSSFEEYPYLISPLEYKNNFSNHNKDTMNTNKRTIHETWNEQIFLEACVIKTTDYMKLSKEFIKANADKTLKEVFPEVCKIDYNEPILSLNDLLSVWDISDGTEYYKTSVLFKRFEKLAEDKQSKR